MRNPSFPFQSRNRASFRFNLIAKIASLIASTFQSRNRASFRFNVTDKVDVVAEILRFNLVIEHLFVSTMQMQKLTQHEVGRFNLVIEHLFVSTGKV